MIFYMNAEVNGVNWKIPFKVKLISLEYEITF